jgi:hypothetical protein
MIKEIIGKTETYLLPKYITAYVIDLKNTQSIQHWLFKACSSTR